MAGVTRCHGVLPGVLAQRRQDALSVGCRVVYSMSGPGRRDQTVVGNGSLARCPQTPWSGGARGVKPRDLEISRFAIYGPGGRRREPPSALVGLDAGGAWADVGRHVTLQEEDVPRIADLAAANPYANPRPVTREGVEGLLRAAWAGNPPAG